MTHGASEHGPPACADTDTYAAADRWPSGVSACSRLTAASTAYNYDGPARLEQDIAALGANTELALRIDGELSLLRGCCVAASYNARGKQFLKESAESKRLPVIESGRAGTPVMRQDLSVYRLPSGQGAAFTADGPLWACDEGCASTW
ncbi:hypothetical protein AUCHE_08_04360 [Austwickia chelonae NBRC 105200]|uniref:Uncharacterized protein n=1 Tax=Austwickia chelonae NBRC 105200 TaxID=1184607 RepID=K6UMK4_9MICO|nr:hypothetical protein AUCHE_08_04360 [Austwickia chelonae NBRC 105200]